MTPENAEQLEHLTAYLDGELAPNDRAEVERLLDSDAEARRLLEELRETSALVAGLPRGRAPADLAEQVSARLERAALLGYAPARATPVRTGWSWANRLALAAAVVLVCTVAWLGWPHFDEPTATPLAFVETERKLDTFGPEDSALGLAAGRAVDDGHVARRVTAGEKPQPAAKRGLDRSFKAVAKSRAGRRESSGAMSPKQGAEERMRAVASKDVVASRIEVATDAASVEGRLAGNTLNVVELQQTPMSQWSNQMVVRAKRPAEVARLASFINENMVRNDIPNLAAARPADAVAAEASFFNLDADHLHAPTPPVGGEAFGRSRSAPTAETPTVVVHLPLAQAEQLIASIQNHAEDNNVDASWTFNGRPVSQGALTVEVAPQLVASEAQPTAWASKLDLGEDEGAEEADFDDEAVADADEDGMLEADAEDGADAPSPKAATRDEKRRKTAAIEVKPEQRDDGDADETAATSKKRAGGSQSRGAKKTPSSRPARAAPVAGAAGKRGRRAEPRSKPATRAETPPSRTASGKVAAGVPLRSAFATLGPSAADESAFVTLAIALRCDAGMPATAASPDKAKRLRAPTTTRSAPSPTPTEIMGPPAPTSKPAARESTDGC